MRAIWWRTVSVLNAFHRAAPRRRRWLVRLAGPVVGVLAAVLAVHAEAPVETARALLRGRGEDPTRIDRARDLLETALAQDGAADAPTLVTLSRAWFLFAEARAGTGEARLAAWERGRAVAQRAVALAPDDPEAHLWYAIHLGSWAEAKGLLRSLLALKTIREEVDTVLRLDPRNVEGHVIAGSIHRELPAILGGDRALAEQHFKTARSLDPQLTGARIELALLYIKMGRIAEARRELQGVLDEPAPTDRPRWARKEVPRARALLDSIRDRP